MIQVSKRRQCSKAALPLCTYQSSILTSNLLQCAGEKTSNGPIMEIF